MTRASRDPFQLAPGARTLARLERRTIALALRYARYLPDDWRQQAAVALRRCSTVVIETERAARHIAPPWRELQQLFLQTAIAIDAKRSCPHCGRPATAFELAWLKTYCFGCSDFGFPPGSCGPYEDGPHGAKDEVE